MAEFDPGKDKDKAYLAGALVAYALGLKAEPRGLTCLHRLAEAYDLVAAERA